MLLYSRGRNLKDNRPKQRVAANLAEFIAALNGDRAASKADAAYICGPLNGDGRRCAQGALPRRWIAVDFDRIEAHILADVVRWFERFSAAIWQTHSSSPDAPRLRVIIELDTAASRERCMAVGAVLHSRLVEEFGDFVTIDDCTFRPEQPVLVPPTGATIQHFRGAPLHVPEVGVGAHAAGCTEENRRAQRITEAIFCPPLSSSVHLSLRPIPGGAWEIPADTVPTEPGQRNACLFRLARHAKGLRATPTPEDLRHIVHAWHQLARPAIQTQDFAVSFADFMHGYERVRQPHGAVMEAIIDSIDNTPLPAGIEALGYGEAGNLLVRFCAALQGRAGAEPFFLGARQAGELIGAPFTDANRMLQALARDGVVKLITKGVGRKASRYRFVWQEAA